MAMSEEADGRCEIFISHSEPDAALAAALGDALREVFGEHVVKVNDFTAEAEGGAPAGEEWFPWIVNCVRRSKATYTLITPASLQSSWLPWESAAVFGAALSGERKHVFPLRYRVDVKDLPTAFMPFQVCDGLRAGKVEGTFEKLLQELEPVLRFQDKRRAYGCMSTAVAAYVERAEHALRTAPVVATEAAVQEWCGRLDSLRAQGRTTEVEHLDHWMNIAFGRDQSDRARTLDLRLHRRLGELYLDAKNAYRAVEEFELARRLAPRDLFILHKLGLARLEAGGDEDVREILDQMADLDPDAFARNVDCAALKGRWLREKREDKRGAMAIYELAWERNAFSYYAGDLLGQSKLECDDRSGAREVYRQVFEIVDAPAEANVWTHATAANAALVLDQLERAVWHCRKVREHAPTTKNFASVMRGLEHVQKHLPVPPQQFEQIVAALY